MTDGQSDHRLPSHILLSTFGCYEYTENIRNNFKNKINLYLDMKVDISKNTSLMFLSCFLAGLTNNITINTIFLAENHIQECNGFCSPCKIYFVLETIALRKENKCRQTVNVMYDIFQPSGHPRCH